MINPSSVPSELIERFRSFSEWRAWADKHPYIFSADYAEKIIEKIRLSGIVDPLTQKAFSPDQIFIRHDNYRETIMADQLISRHRALFFELKHIAAHGMEHLLSHQSKIYAPEALTDFALFLRGMFPRFLGSEFAETEDEKQAIYPIQTEDLTSLSLKADTFDLIISNDVFEHVSDLDQCLREVARILSSSGVLISTFPFAFNRETGIVKARLKDGQVEHLTEPEYHGNPMKPNVGSLVFEIPGWDIVVRAREAGFDDAYFSFICSTQHGVVGKDLGGVFVFVALKQPVAVAEKPAEDATTGITSITKSEYLRTVATLIGLPRSGTTVFAAAVSVHPEVKAVFEPWNAVKNRHPSTNMGLTEFIDQFQVKFEEQHRVLFVKETAADLIYLHAIDCLLSDATADHDTRLIWLYRDPIHAYLSEVQARKLWWGLPEIEANVDTFTEWALRSLRAFHSLIALGYRHKTMCVDYGTFVAQPEESLKCVMSFLGLEFLPSQMDYFKSVDKQQIRGDLNVTNNPQMVSTDSNTRRASEAKLFRKVVSQARFYKHIQAVSKAAEMALVGRVPNIEDTRAFLEEVDKVCSSPDMPPPSPGYPEPPKFR